ncbi:MAG TPA: alpha/beta hydrolase [Dongiaceae bacterium]|nr:alpha/beta hydrolase [Dongiaceae bacterium]
MILFVHGWGYDARVWDPVRTAMGDVPSAAIDLGYFGSTDTTLPRDLTLLVGHSLGFLWLARQGTLEHVPLLGINAFPRFLEATDYRPAIAPRMLERMKRRVLSDTRGVLEDFWTRAGAVGPDREPNAAALATGLDHLAAWDERENLAARASSTRLIAGKEDAIVPAAMTEMAFKGCKVTWLAGGHALPCTHAADIARLIQS